MTTSDLRNTVRATCELWDRCYASQESFFGSVPNEFLLQWVKRLGLAPGARVLSLGEGEGRDALWLARQGLRVTAVDGSPIGMQKLARSAGASGLDIDIVCANLADYWPRQGHYDLVLSLFCHLPPALRAQVQKKAARALRPGGHLLVHGFARRQLLDGLTSGGPPDIEWLYDPLVLGRELAAALDTIHLTERRVVLDCGDHSGDAAVVEYCGRARPARTMRSHDPGAPHTIDTLAAAPTSVIPLHDIRPGLWGKVEYRHPSGSIKHRSIPAFLETAIARAEVRRGQPVLIHSAGSAAIAAAWAGARLGCPVHALIPHSTDAELITALKWLGARCHKVRSRDAPTRIRSLVAELDGYFLDQFREARLIDHYRPIADEILAQVPGVDTVITGIGTGLSITGIGRQLKKRSARCALIGVEPAEARVAAGQPWGQHRIPGLAPPMAQALLDHSVLNALVGVSSEEAWAITRKLARAGLLVGPAAGATVAAALATDRRAATIVAILSGGMLGHMTRAGTLKKDKVS